MSYKGISDKCLSYLYSLLFLWKYNWILKPTKYCLLILLMRFTKWTQSSLHIHRGHADLFNKEFTDINSPNLGISCKTLFSGSVLPCFIWRWMEKNSWRWYKNDADRIYRLEQQHQLLTMERKNRGQWSWSNKWRQTVWSMYMPSLVTWCNTRNETVFVTFKSEEDDTVHMPNYFQNPNLEKHLCEIAIAMFCFGRKGKEVPDAQFHLSYWKGTWPWTFSPLIYKYYLLILLGSWSSIFNDLISITQCWLGGL